MPAIERIVPANLDGDELWKRNGEYVDADAYDRAVARIETLEAALRKLVDGYYSDDESRPSLEEWDDARNALRPAQS